MSGFISKPVELEELKSSLVKWLSIDALNDKVAPFPDLSPQRVNKASAQQRGLLERLRKLLQEDDTHANALYGENREFLSECLGAERSLSFGEAIELFDYPAALELLGAIDEEVLAEVEYSNAGSGPPLIDRQALVSVFGDNADQHRQFLYRFRDQMAQLLPEIEDELANSRLERVGFHAHKLKTSARTVGATLMARYLLELEEAARSQQVARVTEVVSRIKPLFEELYQFISAEY